MRNPLHSLRAQLIMLATLVIAIAATGLGPRFRRVTSSEFEHYLSAADSLRGEPYRALVADYHRRSHGWAGVDSVLDEIARVSGYAAVVMGADGALHLPTIGPLAGAQFIRTGARHSSLLVHDPPGVVAADAPRVEVTPEGQLRIRRTYAEDGVRRQSLIMLAGAPVRGAAGERIGTLYLAPGHLGPRAPRSRESDFVDRVNRGQAVTIILAIALSALLGLVLLGRVLRPVEQLTAAARRMEHGDRDARVTVRRHDEIGELAHAFNAMADSVARTERLRRDMVGDVAHELRTPLTNLRCQIEALQDGLATPDEAAFASLHQEAMVLGRLVEDLQQLALAEAGQLRLERAPLDMHATVARVLAALEPRARAARVALANDVPVDLAPADADRERVGQVLRNLLDNAVRHAGARVRVGARRQDGMIEIAVSDDGPGIARVHHDALFERFYRTDASRARATGGAGLGLAIARQLVRTHGGDIRVDSMPGAGATFSFTLPVAPS